MDAFELGFVAGLFGFAVGLAVAATCNLLAWLFPA